MMRLVRLVGVSARGLRGLRLVLGRRGVVSLVIVTMFVVVMGAAILTVLEPELTDEGYWSNVQWAVVTVLTLRYVGLETGWGDAVNLAFILMGVALRASLAASIAAYFIGTDRDRLEKEILASVMRLEQTLSEVIVLRQAAAGSEDTAKSDTLRDG